jgi:ATP-dependent DNA helicase UvrD/PcrA
VSVALPIDERPWLEELNDEQRRAATHPGGPLLILAGAGTGKTTTLCARVAWLVAEGAASERILLLTFTRRAAREMLQRARALVPASTRVLGGTFHSVAHRLVRRHAAALGLPGGFGVLDASAPSTSSTSCARSTATPHRARASRARPRCWTSTRARSTPSCRCPA